jgi:glycogen synthase
MDLEKDGFEFGEGDQQIGFIFTPETAKDFINSLSEAVEIYKNTDKFYCVIKGSCVLNTYKIRREERDEKIRTKVT